VSGQAEDGHQPAVVLVQARNHWAGDAAKVRADEQHALSFRNRVVKDVPVHDRAALHDLFERKGPGLQIGGAVTRSGDRISIAAGSATTPKATL